MHRRPAAAISFGEQSETTRMKTNRCAALVVLLSALATGAAADQGSYLHGPHMWGGGWMGWFAGPVMMIAMIAIVVAVVVLIIRWLGGPGHGSVHLPTALGKTPLDILEERYARGEIDREEFEERRSVLGR